MRPLTQDLFVGKAISINVVCVDYDGLLKFGTNKGVRWTWASERWRGADWLIKIPNTDYKPLTHLIRHVL
jgi:hypothetical protein